jgi:hypothetical protein
MTKHYSLYGVSSDKLAMLLTLGSGQGVPPPTPDSQDKTSILQTCLSSRLPNGRTRLPYMPGQEPLERALHADASLSIGELLKDAQTPVAVLGDIKAYAAHLSRSAQSSDEKEAAHVLYYAAIARALVFHGNKITELSWAEMQQAFHQWRLADWVGADLNGLFAQAFEACSLQQKEPEHEHESQ